MRTTQIEPHIIPDDTEVLPSDTHLYNEIPFKVTPVHRYNTRDICLTGHNIITNHVTKNLLLRKIPTPAPTNTMAHQIGKDWVHTNSTTREVTIQAGLMSSVIYPETGKSKEYRHPLKVLDKPKWIRAMDNDIAHLFQGIIYIEVTYMCFFIHINEVPQYRKVTY